MESEFLKYGDLILLHSQDFSGAVSSFGFLDVGCFLQQTADHDLRHTLNSRCMVFQLLPRLSYQALLEYQKLKRTFQLRNREGQLSLEPEELDLIESLQLKLQTEKDLNERNVQERTGSNVLYGQEVHFKHVSSNMFLRSKRQTAENDRSCYLLELSEHGSRGASFQILPRYKYRQEGDPIMYSDFLLIVNVKLGLYLHISDKPIDLTEVLKTKTVNKSLCSDGAPAVSTFAVKYEVNVSTQQSIFQFSCFGLGTADSRFIQGGTVVKLWHTELGGLLCSDGIDYTKDGLADVYVRKYKGVDQLERSSAHTYFILETDSSTHRGQVCSWHSGSEPTFYRLRHLTTRRIISVAEDTDGQILSLGKHPHEGEFDKEMSLFAFIPTAIETANKIRDGSIAKIKAKVSDHYLATISEEWVLASDASRKFSDLSPGDDESGSENHDFFLPLEIDEVIVARRKIVLTTKSQIEDAYQINIADPEEVRDIEYVMSTVSVLKHFGALFEQRKERDRASYQTVEETLGRLILFCNSSDNRDPYTCEGEPIGRRQKFMRELGVIDLVCNILYYPFERKMYSLESLRKTELMTKICILGYRLVRLAAKDNRVNELYCAQWMGLFLSHAEKTTQNDNLHPEETLTEILSDNRRLLERQIRPRMIRKFVNLIRRGRDEKYAKLIASLCTCNNQAITRNQNTISDVIASDSTFTETMMVKIRTEGRGIEVEIAEMQKWVRLEAFKEFSESHDDGKVYKYFLALLDLISELAFDRNHQTDALRSYYSFETCFACASNPQVNDTVRSKFVRILLYLHIDQGDVQPLSLPNYTRIWSRLDTDEVFSCRTTTLSTQIQDTKQFVLEFLTNLNGVQRADEPSRNELTKQVLLLTQFLVAHGVYLSARELEELAQPLIELLDGTTDTIISYTSLATSKAFERKQSDLRLEKYKDKKSLARYEVNESNLIIIKCKRIICSILNTLMTIRLDYQLSHFLTHLKEDSSLWEEVALPGSTEKHHHSNTYEEVVSVQELEPLKSDSTYRAGIDERALTEKAIGLFKETLQDPLLLLTMSDSEDLITVLMDLMLYTDMELVKSSFLVLLRHFTQGKAVVAALQDVQLLETQEAERTFGTLKEKLVTLNQAAEIAEVWLGREVSDISEVHFSAYGSDVQVRLMHTKVNAILQFFIALCTRLSDSNMQFAYEPEKEEQGASFLPLPSSRFHQPRSAEASIIFSTPREYDSSRPLDLNNDPEDRISGMLFRSTPTANKENQRLLRNLNAYQPVLELVRHKGILTGYSEARHRSVLRHCYVFLSSFCHKNPQNQQLLYVNMEEFIEDLDKDACAGLLIQEIFLDNSELCGKVSAKYIRMIVRQISEMPMSMEKCNLFKTLTVLVKTKDQLFKANQLEVVIQLANSDLSTVLLIYNNTESLSQLERNIKTSVKLYGGTPPVVHQQQVDVSVDASCLISLVDLLSVCSEEWNGQSEVICQRILSESQLNRLFNISELFWPLRNVLMLFFLNVYLDIEFSTHDNETVLWLFLERMNGDMHYIFHNYTRNGRTYSSAIEGVFYKMGDHRVNVVEFALHYVYGAIVPTLIEIFMKRGEGLQTERHVELIKSIITLAGNYRQSAGNRQQVQTSGRLLKVISDIEKLRKHLRSDLLDLEEKIDPSARKRESEHRVAELTDFSKASALMKISKGLLKSDSLNELMESEFHTLVYHMKNIEKISLRAFGPGEVITSNALLKAFISFLRGIKKSSPDAEEIWLIGLKILRKYVELGNPDQQTPAAEWETEDWEQCKMYIVQSQNLLMSLQAVSLICAIFAKTKERVLKSECVLLMITMLLGGNQLVQTEFLTQIAKSQKNKFLLAIKTTLETGFDYTRVASRTLIGEGKKHIRDRLRESLLENTERESIANNRMMFENPCVETLIENAEEKHSQYQQLTQNILRFLQLLCEGHNLDLQKFLRQQTLGDVVNLKTFNMVSFVGGLMGMYTKMLHKENINLGFQILDTLTEMTQGPCRDNQRELSHPKIVDNCRELLISLGNEIEKEMRGFNLDDEAIEDISELKSKTASFLLSLLEGETDVEIVNRIASSLDFNMIKERMSNVFKAFVKKEFNRDSSSISLSDIEDRLKKDSFDGNVEEGFNLYILMNKLADSNLEAEKKREGGSPEQQKAFTFFKEHTGRIEIVVDKVLQRIYFPILPICKHISEPSKEELLAAVNRDTPASKVTDLLTLSTGMIEEMEHNERLSHVYFHPDMEKFLFLRDLCFALSFFINLLILFHYDFTLTHDQYLDPLTTEVVDICGALSFGFSALCVIIWLMLKGKVHIKAKWRDRVMMSSRLHSAPRLVTQEYIHELTAKMTWTILLQRGPDAVEFQDSGHRNFRFRSTKVLYYVLSTKMLLEAGSFLMLLLYTLFSALGFMDVIFFAFLLIDVVYRFPTLSNILRAVVVNKQQLLMTSMLSVMVTFIYSLWGFYISPEMYYEAEIEPWGETMCQSLFQCFLTTLDEGPRLDGGIGNIMEKFSFDDKANYYSRFFLDLSHFLLFRIMFLNIILGTIIDSFAQMREKKKSQEEDKRNKCFICSIDRSVLDRANGHEKHISEDHNVWHYIYFLVYLKYKDPTEYNGGESYCANLVEKEDIAWVPQHQALCVGDAEKGNEEDLIEVADEKVREASRIMDEINKKLQN